MKREVILEACRNLGELLFKKNQAYGSSFAKSGKILEVLFDGEPIPPKMFMQALLMVRVIDKLSRLAHDADAFGESPWSDVAGYGIIGMIMSGKLPPMTEPEPGFAGEKSEAFAELLKQYNDLRVTIWSVMTERKAAATPAEVFAEEHIDALKFHNVSDSPYAPAPFAG